eukprot:164900_1
MSKSVKEQEEEVIGGGAINEKKRHYGERQNKKKSKQEKEESSQNRNKSKSSNNNNDYDATAQQQKSINTKTNFNPQKNTSHLLHALVGLDRYPNYISRWNYNLVEDVERLEEALEEQLKKVRHQKERLLDRNTSIRNLVKEAQQDDENFKDDGDINIGTDNHNNINWNILKPPKDWKQIKENVLDPKCVNAIFGSKMFRRKDKDRLPSLLDVMEGEIQVELDGAQCEQWLEQEMYDVYSFPLLKPSFCMELKKVMKRLIHHQQEQMKHNGYDNDGNDNDGNDNDGNDNGNGKQANEHTLGVRPIDLDVIGASWINDLLFHLIIRPLSKHLFEKTECIDDLDWRHGYIVGYSNKPSGKKGAQRHRLVPHTDDSEVTLNVGMGDNFEGGDLAFWGLRNSEDQGNFVGDFHPVIGTALLHAGRHLHEVKNVTNGDRYAYIIWARSWKGARSMSCPCCWLNRRQQIQNADSLVGNSCICSQKWN